MENRIEIDSSSNIGPEAGVLTIHIPSRSFGDMLSNLLGQRRSVRKHFYRRFSIDMNWISDFISLIHQRVSSQNTGDLVDLRATFFFDSGKTVEISGVDSVQSYIDISQDRSVGVRIDFTYLIFFPGRPTPERQDVSLEAKTCSLDNIEKNSVASLVRKSLLPLNEDTSYLVFRVKTTDITWAEDLINLVTNRIHSHFHIDFSRLDKYRTVISGNMYVVLFVFAFINLIYLGYRMRTKYDEINNRVMGIFLSNSYSFGDVDIKLKSIYDAITVKEGLDSVFVPALLFAIPVIVVGLLQFILGFNLKSHVILNEYSKISSAREDRFIKFIRGGVFASFVLGVAASLVASYIYGYIS